HIDHVELDVLEPAEPPVPNDAVEPVLDDDEAYARQLMAYAERVAANGANGANGRGAARRDNGAAPADGVIRGKRIQGDPVPIKSLSEESMAGGPVIVRGEVIRVETRELRRGQRLVEFDVTDRTDSVTCKVIEPEDGPVGDKLT